MRKQAFWRAGLAIVLLLIGVVVCGQSEEMSCIALLGRVIDGTGSDPIEDGVVLIEGEHIIAVGERQSIAIPTDAITFETDNATILPGFINTHVHNSASWWMVNQWILGGVTTVRDLGAPPDEWQVAAARYANERTYPTVLWAGPIVTVPNGYPIVPNGFESLAVESPSDAQAKVAQLIEDGIDVVKIAIQHDEDTVPGCLSLEEIQAIVNVAHEAGLRVTAHATVSWDIRLALDGGVDEIAHYLDAPGSAPWLPERMVKDHIAWIPTLAVGNTRTAPELIEFIRLGGIVALGDDAGYLELVDGMPMWEIRAMRRVGMTPMEIIVASTFNAAWVCQIDHAVGSLAEGMIADILVVRGNPLDTIDALNRTLWVLKRGLLVVDNVGEP